MYNQRPQYELMFYTKKAANEYRNLIYKKGYRCFTLRIEDGRRAGLYKVFINQ